jgi:hypothetical protein
MADKNTRDWIGLVILLVLSDCTFFFQNSKCGGNMPKENFLLRKSNFYINYLFCIKKILGVCDILS